MEKGKVDTELIGRYVRGELAPREMYALERQAQADPMLMDIILGMEQEAPDVNRDNLANIRKRIAERTGQRQTAIRRLAPVQRWAVAASILAVLMVGTWWFTREDTVEQQREAAVVATPDEAPQTTPEARSSPAPPTVEREAGAAPQRARTAPSAAAAAHEEKKIERLAVATPKADAGVGLQDSAVVVGYGAQKKSAVTGAAARIAAAEMDIPVTVNEQVPAGRTDGFRIRGVSGHKHAGKPSLTDNDLAEDPRAPAPKRGWDAYRQYLKDAMKLAQGLEGTVDLAFTVDDDGRPTEIAVVETTDEKLNAFATLIVRDGPRWVSGANDERKVTLRIAF